MTMEPQPSIWMVFPITDESPPNRRCQRPQLKTTLLGGMFGFGFPNSWGLIGNASSAR